MPSLPDGTQISLPRRHPIPLGARQSALTWPSPSIEFEQKRVQDWLGQKECRKRSMTSWPNSQGTHVREERPGLILTPKLVDVFYPMTVWGEIQKQLQERRPKPRTPSAVECANLPLPYRETKHLAQGSGFHSEKQISESKAQQCISPLLGLAPCSSCLQAHRGVEHSFPEITGIFGRLLFSTSSQFSPPCNLVALLAAPPREK